MRGLRFQSRADIVPARPECAERAVLCLHRLCRPIEPTPTHSPLRVVHEHRRLKLKVGPLWKLMHVVEPAPTPVHVLRILDEKNESPAIDGPFAETKS